MGTIYGLIPIHLKGFRRLNYGYNWFNIFTVAMAVFLSSLIIGDWDTQEIATKLIKMSVVFLIFAVCADIVIAMILAVIGG